MSQLYAQFQTAKGKGYSYLPEIAPAEVFRVALPTNLAFSEKSVESYITDISTKKYTERHHDEALYDWQKKTLHFMTHREQNGRYTLRFPQEFIPFRDKHSSKNHTTFLKERLFHTYYGITKSSQRVKQTLNFMLPPLNISIQSEAPGGIISSAVGTGKTAVVLKYIQHGLNSDIFLPTNQKTLILVKSELEAQWILEMKRVWGKNYINVIGETIKSQNDMPYEKYKEQFDQVFSPDDRFNIALEMMQRQQYCVDKFCRSRMQTSSSDGNIRVWVCSNIQKYYKPPKQWDVMLVTFEFFASNVMTMTSKKHTNFNLPPEAFMHACAVNNFPTLFADISWERIIVDEIQDFFKVSPIPVIDFMNKLPSKHMWGITATPSHFNLLASFLRLKVVSAVSKTGGFRFKNFISQYKLQWQLSAIVNGYSFAISHADSIKEILPSVKTQVINLQLTVDEQQLFDFIKMSDKKKRECALICTDIQSYLESLKMNCTEKVRYLTTEMFWEEVKLQNSIENKEFQVEEHELVEEMKRLNEIKSALIGIIDEDQSMRNVQTALCTLQNKYDALQAKKTKIAASKQFLDNLSNRIDNAKDNPCSICILPIEDDKLAITPCGHAFCTNCLTSWLSINNICPMCRHMPLRIKDVVVFSDKTEDQMKKERTFVYSTKLDFLLSQLRQILSSANDKVIIFTHYPETSNKLFSILKNENIHAAKIVGNTSCKNANMNKFKNSELTKDSNNCRVMLLNTITQNSGMDLIQANHIIFLDTYELTRNDLIQAIGRCRRLGQTKTINVQFICVQQEYESSGNKLALFLDWLKDENNII